MSCGVSDPFSEHRPLLFTVAYELLGSAADADDVLQDSWLRWAEVDQETVANPRAYLVRIVTRQALNRLRTIERRRESYVGPWLPEPLLTTPDVAEDVELADSVSMAMLVVLETLSPVERAVFVLREVFGFEYEEVAAATGKSRDAVRQVAHRAREHVRARRPRVTTGPEVEHVAASFFAAAATGDVGQLMELLAPDAVLISDGGGKKKAALKPITGAAKIIRFLAAIRPPEGEYDVEVRSVNGGLSVLIHLTDGLDSVASVDVVGGRVTAVYLSRNPDKLSGVAQERRLSRR